METSAQIATRYGFTEELLKLWRSNLIKQQPLRYNVPKEHDKLIQLIREECRLVDGIASQMLKTATNAEILSVCEVIPRGFYRIEFRAFVNKRA